MQTKHVIENGVSARAAMILALCEHLKKTSAHSPIRPELRADAVNTQAVDTPNHDRHSRHCTFQEKLRSEAVSTAHSDPVDTHD